MATWTKYKIQELLNDKAILEIQDGNHGELHPQSSDYVIDGEKIPFVMANDIRNNSIDFENCKFIPKNLADSLRIGFAKVGDVLLTHKGTVGEVAIVPKTEYPYIMLTPQVTYYRVNPNKLNALFLSYIFRCKDFQYKIHHFNSQSTREYIGITSQKQLDIALPTVDLQNKIASILYSYDELINNNEKRIKILEEMAQRLYTEWFVKFRFPGHEKNKLVDSGTEFGKIPEGWEVSNVEKMVRRISAGKKYDNNSVFKAGRIPVLDQGKTGVIGYHNDSPGVNASISSPVIVFANHTCYQTLVLFPFSAIQNVLPFIPSDKRNIFWLHWATKDLISFNDYKGHWPEFMSKRLIIPSIELTTLFGSLVGNYVRLKYQYEVQNKNLAQIRDLLISQLVTGKTKLN